MASTYGASSLPNYNFQTKAYEQNPLTVKNQFGPASNYKSVNLFTCAGYADEKTLGFSIKSETDLPAGCIEQMPITDGNPGSPEVVFNTKASAQASSLCASYQACISEGEFESLGCWKDFHQ